LPLPPVSPPRAFTQHWPDRASNIFDKRAYDRSSEVAKFTPFDETVGAVGELLKAGKIKQWGLSNENAVGVCKILESCARLNVQKPVTIQNDFSVLHRKFEEDGTAEACSPLHSGVANGIVLLAYGALAGGTLSGKYKRGPDGVLVTAEAKRARHALFPQFQPRYFSGSSIDTTDKLVGLAKRYGITPSQLALQWAASREYMGSVIIGATTLEQLRENINVWQLPALTDERVKEIDAACYEMFTPYYSRVGEVKAVKPA
jgi:aryl-alcohol dehydrogenase-like predicted oxidoreductase